MLRLEVHVVLTGAMVALMLASCGIGKDKYADYTCEQLKDEEREQLEVAESFTSAFQREPTKSNEKSMKAALANVAYARDVMRDKACEK